MMRALALGEGLPNTLVCALYRQFPPQGHRKDQTPEDLLRGGHIGQDEYARFKTWQRICGLSRMEEGKCRGCPHCRRLEDRDSQIFMISLDGKFKTPFVDTETIGLRHSGLPVHTRSSGTGMVSPTAARPGNRGMT